MNLIDTVAFFVKRDKDKYNMSCNLQDTLCIANSCDGTVHPTTKWCDRKILTQNICLVRTTCTKFNCRNLVAPGNLLSIMSSNGKEDAKTMDNVFEHYFNNKKEKKIFL